MPHLPQGASSTQGAGSMKVYRDPNDLWVGYYRGPNYHYVCVLPTLVIRWVRRRRAMVFTAAADPAPHRPMMVGDLWIDLLSGTDSIVMKTWDGKGWQRREPRDSPPR